MCKKRGGMLLLGFLLLLAFAGTASAAAPNVVFDTQYPPDISSNNTLGGIGLNITYNITGANESKILLFYNTNSSTSNVAYYQNGTAVIGYFTQNQTSNRTNETFLFRLFDNQILPATYNTYERGMEQSPHIQYEIEPSAAARLKIEILNLSNSTQYNFFEFMPVKTGTPTGLLQLYYCNSSYTTGAVTSSNFCYQFNTYTNISYNHVHSQYSAHAVIPFVINTTTGKIGTVKVTPRSYFIIRPSGDWNITGIPNVSRTGMVQFTTNNGIVWNNIYLNTTDAHVHQFLGQDYFHYYVCANSTADEQSCSAVRSDQYDLANLPPTAPNVYNPAENTTQNGNIAINYTESLSPNGYPIINYNISLLYPNLSYISTIRSNNSINLSYVWNTTGISDGVYVIGVQACDNQGQCSYGYSQNFTVDNNAPNVTLIAPANRTISSLRAYNFTFNVSDAGSISSCVLVFNNSVINNLTTVYLGGVENNFSNHSLPLGTFNWSVNCTDLAGFTGRSGNFELTLEPLYNFTNISITKTDNPDPVNVSSNLTYQINVSSTGNTSAFNVTINDTYPSQVIYLEAQPAPLAGTNNVWILGNLTQGTNISINITVLVMNITNGTLITNSVNATYQNETSYLLSRVETEKTLVINPLVLNTSNISVAKSDNPDPVYVDTILNYTITVTSTGDSYAYNVTANDTYPADVIYISSAPAPLAGTNNVWILGNLSTSIAVEINISVLVKNITNGAVLNNTVNVTFQNDTSALLSKTDSESTTVINPLYNLSNISVTKTGNASTVSPGSQLRYTITVSSTGNGTAYNVTVNDTYAAIVVFDSAQPAPSVVNSTFSLGNMAPGASIAINITVNVSASAPDGVVFYNRVNATFNNETSSLLSANTTLGTTVSAPSPPTPSGGGGGGGGGSYYSSVRYRKPLSTQPRQEVTAPLAPRSQDTAPETQETPKASQQTERAPAITGNAAKPFTVWQSIPVIGQQNTGSLALTIFMLAAAVSIAIMALYGDYSKPKVVVMLHRGDIHHKLVIRLHRHHPKKKPAK